MFGALNRFISRLDAEPLPQATSQGPSDSSYGFQILRNTNTELPLEPWFDFIVGINGHYLDSPDPNLFVTEVRNCAGGFCSLDLWSAKGQRTHALTISVPLTPQSLGLSLQLAPLNSTQNIWHVLTIPSSLSPAHLAGLLPHSDYILGSPSGALKGEAALGELVEDHLNRSLVLWVYNSEFDVVREVELVPRRGWGGEGALGAVLGYGALHRLPVGLGEEVQAPGENLFDADVKANDEKFLYEQQLPTQTFSPPPPPMLNVSIPPPPMMSPNVPPPSKSLPASKAKRGKYTAVPKAGFDDIFAEGEKKSAERDFVPSRKGTPLAPPPRIGSTAPPEEKQNLPQDELADLGEPGEAELS